MADLPQSPSEDSRPIPNETPSAKVEAEDLGFPPELASLIDPDTPPEVVERVVSAAMMYAGPLPPPHMLDQYESVQQGLADRIVSMAENEQKIRGRGNSHLLWNDTARVIGSVIVSVILVGGAIYSASIGQVALAIALAGTGAVPQIIRFFNKSK